MKCLKGAFYCVLKICSPANNIYATVYFGKSSRNEGDRVCSVEAN